MLQHAMSTSCTNIDIHAFTAELQGILEPLHNLTASKDCHVASWDICDSMCATTHIHVCMFDLYSLTQSSRTAHLTITRFKQALWARDMRIGRDQLHLPLPA